ncbi:hypothetical protein AB0885_40405, partial [Streptomyces sp. NPDC005534]|uniref:hypothetical protein n=1 Tax=Streptomyces sp. NPDC005534 TaxID=3155714 RepID=UPI00345451B3
YVVRAHGGPTGRSPLVDFKPAEWRLAASFGSAAFLKPPKTGLATAALPFSGRQGQRSCGDGTATSSRTMTDERRLQAHWARI